MPVRTLGLATIQRMLGLSSPAVGQALPALDVSSSTSGTGTSASLALTHAANVFVVVILGLKSNGQALTGVSVTGANPNTPTAIFGGPDLAVHYYFAESAGTDTISWAWSTSQGFVAVALSVTVNMQQTTPLYAHSSFRVTTNMLNYDGVTNIDPASNVLTLVDANALTVPITLTPVRDSTGIWHVDVQLPEYCNLGTWLFVWAATFADNATTTIASFTFEVSAT